MRSRSYPGFSIGILLSVKMNLPLNSVFIPLLNEIHRSMEREREMGEERQRDMTEKKEKVSPPLPPSSSSLLVAPPLRYTIANENTAWDKQLLSG